MRDPRGTGVAREYQTRERLDELGFQHVRYREGTSDERVLYEVLFQRAYRRITSGFDVEQGEHWLDLGANIGAFALYCKWHQARATCFEPDPGCFAVLADNLAPFQGFVSYQSAVTHWQDATVPFWTAKSNTDHHRATAFPMKMSPPHPAGHLPNQWIGEEYFRRGPWDGIKMDIEGAELGILDHEMIPPVRKLVLEYHTWRDSSMPNMRRRIAYLKKLFTHVRYPPEYDRMMASGFENETAYYDRLIFCWNEK